MPCALRALFQQLLAALDFCSAIGVANRNLTPAHILLMDDGAAGGAPKLKLAGFAMSKDENSDSLCKTACGSPGYVAPEARSSAPLACQGSHVWDSKQAR